MRSASYSMEIIENVTWKEDNFERMEAQSTSIEKSRHSQKWMKKNEQLDMNEGIKNQERFTLSEAYMGSFGISPVHMRGDL
jgi:hypothetical protein